MSTLDLHGKRHADIDRITENFILLNEIGKACISQNISYNDIEMVLTENEYISY